MTLTDVTENDSLDYWHVPLHNQANAEMRALDSLIRGPGLDLFVNTVTGSDDNAGTSWDAPLLTMAAAFALATDNSRIMWIGNIREQVLAPLGVQGLRIIAMAGGGNRHDDGARWYAPASPTAGAPLLTLREQGCEVHGGLFVPHTNSPAIRTRRAEDATYPDGSHAIIRGIKVVADTGTAIEDYGGCHHVLVEDCEFTGAETALPNGINSASTAIANPLRWTVRRNTFITVTNAINMPFTQSVVERNKFGAGTIIVETDGGDGANFVLDNYFPDATADYDTGHGYAADAADIWRNWVTDAADAIVALPAA